MVGKYIRAYEKYSVYVYPKYQTERFRQDDQEYVYSYEYPILGSGYYGDRMCLFYDTWKGGYDSQRYAKGSDFKTINQKEWKKQFIYTVFSTHFEGIVGEGFFEALHKLEQR